MIKDKRAPVKSLLENGILKDLDKGILTISFKKEFGVLCNMLDKEETKEYMSDIIVKITGQNVRPSFIIEDQTPMTDNIDEQNGQKDIAKLLKKILPGEISDRLEIIDG